jgi:hypothetical protein
MGSPVRKKQHERFLLERFLNAASIEADIIEEREVPDFILRFKGRSVGIEVTELFISRDPRQHPLQAQESIATRIVGLAQQIYQRSDGPPAHVSVCFAPGRDLRNLQRDRTANDLAAFVRNLDLHEWQHVDWRHEDFDGALPKEISFVHALGVPSFGMAHWTVAQAGWATPLTPEALQYRINEKAQRLPNYQDAVNENWLLVVADATNPSGLLDTSSHFDASRLSSPFSRTFFYGYPDRAIIELGVQGSQCELTKETQHSAKVYL